MSFINKFAWSGVAVVLAVVLSLGLIAQPRQAEASGAITLMAFGATTLPTNANVVTYAASTVGSVATVSGSVTAGAAGGAGGSPSTTQARTDVTNALVAATQLAIVESTTGQLVAGTLVLNLPSGYQITTTGTCGFTAGAGAMTCIPSANAGGTKLTLTLAGGASTTAATLVTVGTAIRATSNTAAAGNITIDATSTALLTGGFTGGTVAPLAAGTIVGTVATPTAYSGTAVAPYTISLVMTSTTAACGTLNPVTTSAASIAADGSTSKALCAQVTDSVGAAVSGLPVTFTVSTGLVSTGSGKTVVAITSSAGNAVTNYRGAGNAAGSDTAIASNTAVNALGTLAITLTAASGTTAAKVSVISPAVVSLGQSVFTSSPNYQAPTAGLGTFMAAQVTDSTGLGVNTQTILVTTDRGVVIASPAFAVTIATACGTNGQGGTAVAKSITLTTAGTELLTVGGAVTPGAADFILCGTDNPGKANVTVQNISTAMTNGTASVTIGGRPAKITAVASGNAITATVTDAGGNLVADGTPIRFTMSANAGAVSTSCTTSTNGVASSVVALISTTGTVIVSSDWSESSGVQATCAAAGTQQLAVSVAVPGGTSTAGSGTPAAGGSGRLVGSGTVPKTGGSGLIVFGGGTTDQLVTASGCAAATSSFYATNAAGEFVTFVPGTTIAAVNAAFTTLYATGIPANTALIGKCV